jgi:hypothetical protein
MRSLDKLAPDLAAVEADIDVEHLKNPLARLTFSQAAWYFLAFCEEMQFKHLEIDGVAGSQDLALHIDRLVNNMKMPLRWLRQSCKQDTQISGRVSGTYYQASWDLYKLADEFASFEAAYTYARAGIVTLHLQEDTIVPNLPFRQEALYEAYDRLILDDPTPLAVGVEAFFYNVAQTVTVSGERFKYRLNPRIVSQGLDALSPLHDMYWLPESWHFPRYSFGEFRSVMSVLRVIAMIHHFARIVAARNGCVGLGHCDSVRLMSREELSNRLQRYTHLGAGIVDNVVRDATFAQSGIRNPDPAIQPLIQLSSDRIAISPALFLGIDVERNFTVLLNRLGPERKVYSQLCNDREHISRRRIIERLEPLTLRFWHGNVPGRSDLPDVDLAIIDDEQRACLVLELKAFIAPAEPREILEKSEEIQRGVSQIKNLQDAFRWDSKLLSQFLGNNDAYDVYFAVASESFIGTPDVQDESVPVIRSRHLIRRLLSEKSLPAVGKWLQARDYLPIEGQHFEVRDILASVGGWKIKWYGIEPLITEDFA